MFNTGPARLYFPSPALSCVRSPTGARRLIGLVGLALLCLASACTDAETVTAPTEAERVEALLWADGEDGDVVACVLRVGRRAIDRGPLSVAELDELTAGCRIARARLAGEVPDRPDAAADPADPAGPDTEPTTFGQDAELDQLWTECEAGSGAACDELFIRSPVGSGYETFGVSCGGRDDVLHCTELDGPEGSGEPVPLIYRELQAEGAVGGQDSP